MNKKQISVVLSLAMTFLSGTPLFSADKKDVADPVLKEVINELAPKMPRFVDKYGPNIFVSDEQITRSALILALYEYDKKNSIAGMTSNFVSKRDFDLLNSRLTVIERTGGTAGKTASRADMASAGGSVDMVKLMNDLEPNMPMLLDNNLSNSKVFKDLQKKVDMIGFTAASSAAGSASAGQTGASNTALLTMKTDISSLAKRLEAVEISSKQQRAITTSATAVPSSADNAKSKEIEDLKLSLAQIQKSYVNIAKRIDELENKPPLMVSASGSKINDSQIEDLNSKINSIRRTVSSIPTNDYVKSEISKTSQDVKKLEKRIDEIESTGVSSSSSGEGKSSGGGTFAKISLGLTMVAALFVAR